MNTSLQPCPLPPGSRSCHSPLGFANQLANPARPLWRKQLCQNYASCLRTFTLSLRTLDKQLLADKELALRISQPQTWQEVALLRVDRATRAPEPIQLQES